MTFITEEKTEPTSEELAELGKLIQQWKDNEALIEQTQRVLKSCTEVKNTLETGLLPICMAQAGNVAKLTLEDGTEIKLDEALYASIAKANEPQAFAWLEGNGLGDIIKDELKIALGKGEAAKARAEMFIESCERLGIDNYSRKRAVHPGTLQATLKEQIAKGVQVPKEMFGVYQETRAKIKVPK